MTKRTDSDAWAPIRRKLAGAPLEPLRFDGNGQRLPPRPLPRQYVPTNEELADALEQAADQPIPYEMRALIAYRLRVSPTPGIPGRRTKETGLPDDVRVVCGTFVVCWNAHHRRRGTRAIAIEHAASITGKTESTVRTMLKNHWKAFRAAFPDVAEWPPAVKNDDDN